jgi:quercetin dioxygenase-like cupin family protein
MCAPYKLRVLCFILQGALTANSGLVRAQSPASSAKVLLNDAVGPAGPKVSISEITIARGSELHSQGAAGPAFIYVIEGKIEGQEGSNTARIYEAGEGLRHQRTQDHRVLRNASPSAPAKLLVFQFADAGDAKVGRLVQLPLDDAPGRNARLNALKLDPAWVGNGAHSHGGPVFIYVLKGAVESQVEPNKPEVYSAGEFFHELPGQIHRLFRNFSKTEPAELLTFQVSDEKGAFTAAAVK